MTNSRLSRLREEMLAREIDALVVSRPINRRYLSGFSSVDDDPGSPSCWLLITPSREVLLTAFTDFDWARSESSHVEVEMFTNAGLVKCAAALLISDKARNVGFESTYFACSIQQELSTALEGKAKLRPGDGLVEKLRVRKDEGELALMAKAARVTDEALATVVRSLDESYTEQKMAWAIEREMRELGAEGIAFEVIVAFGPNAALPHSRVSERRLVQGEPILVDIGARCGGYCADLTRTFCLGWASEQFSEVFSIVHAAQSAALEMLRAGASGSEVDAAARQVISDAGYGDAFGHGLGHGVGLAVHENPRLSRMSSDILLEGSVVTVEPGIYLPEWGGVRIEDSVIVRADGWEMLTHSPKTQVV